MLINSLADNVTMPKFFACIPARGGSKGLPRKNLINLNGKPLIVWTIEAALSCNIFDRVVVTSEDNEILRVAKKYSADILVRPVELATDNASSFEVVVHFIEALKLKDEDFIVLLQPTSPLRTALDIKNAIDRLLLKNSRVKGVVSCYKPSHHPAKSYILNDDGFLKGFYSDESPYMRRQDLPEVYYPNGAIYIYRVAEIKRSNNFPLDNICLYEMPEALSYDIDSLADLKIVETIMGEWYG